MRRAIALCIAVLVASLGNLPVGAATACSAPVHSGGEWPLYGGDLANSRTQPEEAVISADEAPHLAPAWTFSSKGSGGDGDFTGTPVVAGGCVFVGSNLGWLYAIDAATGAPAWKLHVGDGTINSSLAVARNLVFAAVSHVGAPYVIAVDQQTGVERWRTTIDTQEGSDAFASPTVFGDVVIAGVSGDAAQHDDQGVRDGFHGSYVLLDADDGSLLKKGWTIPQVQWDGGYAGASVSATPAVDAGTATAYIGTTSSYSPQNEHPHANAILAVDLARDSESFGEILRAYKGDTLDHVIPGYSTMPCEDLPIPPPPPIIPTGRGVGACGDIDVDFASSPNLFTNAANELVVGAAQKSGRYHAARAADMAPAWTTTWGPAQPFGGVSTAYDGMQIIGGGAPPGYLYSLDARTGGVRWIAPVADGTHYGIPVAVANGVAYTVDVKGFLDAYDTATGAPLLHRPMLLGADTGTDPVLSFGGVSVAQNTVFAAVGIQSTGIDFANVSNGYVVAFRPDPIL
ncbi:MAG TPA: PQQ-binding-like beta-propeller repeat protein [Actinomycetota bacterium]|nr:PQQ-binding-like beta-propeller repeat protein [Actinomycetota bacterium]